MKNFNLINKYSSTLALTLALSTATSANETEKKVEKIDVWGTKVSSSSVFVSDEDIASRQADHLSDLLRDIPGVEVGGTSSLNQRINIRGFGDQNLRVVIDGAVQNNYMYHHMGNLLINPDLLKSVDVQVGANSVIYAGLGGAVEFTTKDARDLLAGDDKFGVRTLVGYNTNASQYLTATAYAQLTDTFDLLAYGSYNDRDDYKDGSGFLNFGQDGTVTNYMVKLGAHLADNQRLSVKYDNYTDDGDYAWRPDMGGRTNVAISGDAVFPTQYERETLSGHYLLDLGDSLNLRANLYQNTSTLWRNGLGNRDIFIVEGQGKQQGFSIIANSLINHADLAHQFTYGIESVTSSSEYQSYAEDNTILKQSDEEGTEVSVYAEDIIDFGNGFLLTPGVRYNQYGRTFNDGSDNDWHEIQTALSAQYHFANGISLKASSTGLSKAPAVGEIFTNSAGIKVNNPNLEPETGRNNQAGVTYQTYDNLGADHFAVAFTYFNTDIDNYIEQSRKNDDGLVTDNNIGSVTIKGFETSLNYRLADFNALLSYAKSNSQILDIDDEARLGEPLEREVGDSISLSLDYSWSEITLQWLSMFVLKQERTTTRILQAKPSYNVHNIGLTYQPQAMANLQVVLGVENIFDRLYVSHASRVGESNHPVFGELVLHDYEPGRNVKLSMAYSF